MISRIQGSILILTILFSISLHAQQAETFFKEGKQHLVNKNYSGAVKSFSKAITENDHEAKYFCGRGQAYLNLKQDQMAYNDLSAAVKYDYMLAEAYLYRSMVFERNHMMQDAVNDLDMVIKYATTDSMKNVAYLARSGDRMTVRDFKGAFDDASLYYQHDSTSKDALNNMAMSKHEMKQHDEAIRYLNMILTSHPQDTNALMNMGFIYLTLEKWDTAYYFLDRAYQLNSKDAYTLSNLSFVKMKTGDLKGALKGIDNSIDINPNNSWAYRNRGLIYMEMADSTKACQEFRMAVKKGFTDKYGTEVSELIYKYCSKK
jgi:tetratricopeptide (TPR) repeat protein